MNYYHGSLHSKINNMKTTPIQELIIILIALVPFIYLATIFSTLPDIIPIHFNANGTADSYGNKNTILLLPILLCGIMYFLFKDLPKLDPKKQLFKMGNKYYILRLLLTLFMSGLAFGIIYQTVHYNSDNAASPNWIFTGIGILFLVLGNFMPSTKRNYFIGIRTPWTLESDYVWRKTNRLGGILFMLIGITVIISSFTFNPEITTYIVIGTTFAMLAISFIYSYKLFNLEKLKNETI